MCASCTPPPAPSSSSLWTSERGLCAAAPARRGACNARLHMLEAGVSVRCTGAGCSVQHLILLPVVLALVQSPARPGAHAPGWHAADQLLTSC